jgi:hypothetical protein
MNLKWVKHSDDKDRIKSEVESSRFLFDVLESILEEMNVNSLKKMRSDNIFNKLSWKDSVAFELGYQMAIDHIKELIKE